MLLPIYYRIRRLVQGFLRHGQKRLLEGKTIKNWNTNALYFVCRFANDAAVNCKAKWDGCVHNYVTAREWFQKATLRNGQRAVAAGKIGFKTRNIKDCDPFKK
jgi:hypothetical protein